MKGEYTHSPEQTGVFFWGTGVEKQNFMSLLTDLGETGSCFVEKMSMDHCRYVAGWGWGALC